LHCSIDQSITQLPNYQITQLPDARITYGNHDL
jgi:hypothetical protein